MTNLLIGTHLAHHEKGNEYCPHCDREDMIFPRSCSCGGLIHRQGDMDDEDPNRYVEICDGCGVKNAEDDALF